MNLPRSAAIRRRLRGAAGGGGGGGAASNVRNGESETNVIIKDAFGPLLRKGAAAPLPASTSSRATLPRWWSTLYASPRHLTAPPRMNTAQARRVRDMVSFDWSVGFTPLSLSLLFSLNSGRTAWRGPPPRIKFWHRLRSGRDRDLEDVLLLRPADLDLPKPPMRPKFLAAEDWREGGGRRPQRASRDRPFPFSLEGLLLPSFALTLFLLISLFSFFLPNGNGES